MVLRPSSGTGFIYDSFGVTVGARYLLGPILASLTYNYLYSSNTTSQGESIFSKNMVLLGLSYAFTNQSFFKMDTFGYEGTRDSVEGISAPSGAGTGGSPSGEGSGILRKE